MITVCSVCTGRHDTADCLTARRYVSQCRISPSAELAPPEPSLVEAIKTIQAVVTEMDGAVCANQHARSRARAWPRGTRLMGRTLRVAQ